MYTRKDLNANRNKPLHDVDEEYCSTLAVDFCNVTYHYVRGLMTFYFSSTVNSDCAVYATAVQNVRGMKFLIDDYCEIMSDCCYRPRSVELLKDENGVKYTADTLYVRYVF